MSPYQFLFERLRYRFLECQWLPDPRQMLVANTRNLEWPGPPPVLDPRDDLLILFHPEVPDSVLGRTVNVLRDLGHEVVVERAEASFPGRP